MIPPESKLRARGLWGKYTRNRNIKEISEYSENLRERLKRDAKEVRESMQRITRQHKEVLQKVRASMY